MKITIDTFVLGSKFRNQGSYVYARKVLEGFSRCDGHGAKFQLLASNSGSSDASLFRRREGFELFENRSIENTKLWRMGMASLAASKIQADVAYFPAPVNCMLSRLPSVVTVYDATVITCPSQKWRKSNFERALIWSALRSASRILTLSQHSKRDFINFYAIPAEKISVVYLGFDANVFVPSADGPQDSGNVQRRLRVTKPYLIHHGVVQPRKNLRRLIDAYRLMLARNPDLDFDLVLAGPIGWRSDDVVKAAHDQRGGGNVVLTGPICEEDLATLIRGASLCVIPSFYEGFSLPLLECMACGTPTIASKTSCLPEVSGGLLRYFDPNSVEDMAETMTVALCDTELRKDLVQKGLHRAAEFSWDRCAHDTLQVLKQTCMEADAN